MRSKVLSVLFKSLFCLVPIEIYKSASLKLSTLMSYARIYLCHFAAVCKILFPDKTQLWDIELQEK